MEQQRFTRKVPGEIEKEEEEEEKRREREREKGDKEE